MLRKPLGWASDVDSLEQCERYGAIYFVIIDGDTKTQYETTIQHFWDFGIGLNRGFGEQIVLPMKYWEIDDPSVRLNPSDSSKSPKPQLALPL